jgi:hypothetical protein
MLKSRESIYAALFKKLSAIPGLKTKSRNLQDWNHIPPAGQPALFMTVENQVPEKEYRRPYRWTLKASVWVYAMGDGTGAGPAGTINGLIDAIEKALSPDSANACTLGGACLDCYISGEIAIGEDAQIANQGIAEIPIEMVAV